MNTFDSNPSVLNNRNEALLKGIEHVLKVTSLATAGLSFGFFVLHASLGKQIVHFSCSSYPAYLALYFMAPGITLAFEQKRMAKKVERFWQVATFFGSFAAGITLCMV